jgi:hemolysin D
MKGPFLELKATDITKAEALKAKAEAEKVVQEAIEQRQNPKKQLKQPKPKEPPKRKASSDNEFLAPALEILETPPSPVRIWFIWLICAFVVVSLTWAYFGRVDIIAVAQGKFQPTGRVKVIEPVETGKVADVLVSNGAHVHEGDVLVQMDTSEAEADRKAASTGLASFRVEISRREAVIRAAKQDNLETNSDYKVPLIEWQPDVPAALRQREDRVLNADLRQLWTSLASLHAQLQQKRVERDRLAQTISAQKNLVATLQQRVDMRQSLLESQSGARSAVIDATETLQYQMMQLAVQQGQLASAETGMDVIERDIDKTRQAFIDDNVQKLGDTERQVEDYEQRLAKANAKLDHLTLRAPISGAVQASVITNVGQVIASGQEVMRIVPQDSGLELEIYVLNRDIGFIKQEQEAVVKVESFPFTRYGTLNARVSRIAHDSIPEPDATQIEGDPSKTSNSSLFAGAQRTQNLVFPVTLIPDQTKINIDGYDVPLTSGMAVTVEIKTGTRRILEYIFSPIMQVMNEAGKER